MIVFYNPHVDDFLSIPPHFSLVKRKALKKYGYIFDGLICEGKLIEVYVDFTMSAFIQEKTFMKLPLFLRKIIVKLELNKWIKDNDLSNKVKIFYQFDSSFSDKKLFCMSYKSMENSNEKRIENLNKFKISIFHLSHYFISSKAKSENLSKLSNLYLCGDADISNNKYFQYYFNWYKKIFLVIPFFVQDRFEIKKDFESRKNLAIATGSFHNLYQEKPEYKYKDYIDFFQVSTYHPIRKILYENKEILDGLIDVKVSSYREIDNSNIIIKLFRKFFVSQKKYFSFDIVELYNSYKFAIVGEENIGFPAIGVFEAMACGCVLIIQKDYYNGLNLEENIHYINYNGTLENLIEKIKYLQQEQELTKQISENGRKYINSNLYKENLYNYFKELVISL